MSTYRRMKFDPMDIKVIILYILYHAGIPLSAAEITDIILADSLLDFFEAHMYITMLIKDGQIEHISIFLPTTEKTERNFSIAEFRTQSEARLKKTSKS